MTSPVASVGRMVHYVSYGTPGGEYASVCRAAVITEVGAWTTLPGGVDRGVVDGRRVREITQAWFDDACHLEVHNPTGLFFNVCEHSEDEHRGGTWHWPERVE